MHSDETKLIEPCALDKHCGRVGTVNAPEDWALSAPQVDHSSSQRSNGISQGGFPLIAILHHRQSTRRLNGSRRILPEHSSERTRRIKRSTSSMIWLLSRKQRDDPSLIRHGAHLDQTQLDLLECLDDQV